MFAVAGRLGWLKLTAAIVATLCSAGPAGIGARAQSSAAPRVVTHIDGVFSEGEQPFVVGWACQQGNKDSIDVRIYADHAPHNSPAGTLVLAGRADDESDPGVGNACQDHEGKHRFKLALPVPMFAKDRGRKLYAEGTPVWGPIPPVSGAYKYPSTHPWVFTGAGYCRNPSDVPASKLRIGIDWRSFRKKMKVSDKHQTSMVDFMVTVSQCRKTSERPCLT